MYDSVNGFSNGFPNVRLIWLFIDISRHFFESISKM